MISQVFLLSLALLSAGHAHAQKASLAEGHYSNPILAGDYPDPSVFRDGDDYYMTHSSGNLRLDNNAMHHADTRKTNVDLSHG